MKVFGLGIIAALAVALIASAVESSTDESEVNSSDYPDELVMPIPDAELNRLPTDAAPMGYEDVDKLIEILERD